MKVKKVIIQDKEVKVYPIYDLRQEFLKEIEKNMWGYELELKVVEISNQHYLNGSLNVFNRKGEKIRHINYQMYISDIYQLGVINESKSYEFSKRQTRLEKKLYITFLGLPDPEEEEALNLEEQTSLISDKLKQQKKEKISL